MEGNKKATLRKVHVPGLEVEPDAAVLDGTEVNKVPVGIAVHRCPWLGVEEEIVDLVQADQWWATRGWGLTHTWCHSACI